MGSQPYTEEELLRLLGENLEEGAAALLETYSGLVCWVCSRRLPDPEDVKECVNDTFAGFCREWTRFDPEKGSLKNYLCMLADRRALDRYRKNQRQSRAEERARELLGVFGMESVADQMAANLPYGMQRKLEILRALAADPQLLLLDEPAAGMNPTETHELMEVIRSIRERFQVAILLIEHDMSLVMNVCERLYVLDYGQLIASGTPDDIRRNEKVITAYLGG